MGYVGRYRDVKQKHVYIDSIFYFHCSKIYTMTNIENLDSSIFANVFKGVYLNFIADYTKNMNRLFEYKSVASGHWRADSAETCLLL